MSDPAVDDELWTEFHRVVNMTSRELEDWLRTRDAGPADEPLPDEAGPPTGHEVLAILRKRRVDTDGHDASVMRKVIDRVHAERREDLEPVSGEAHWRHRLMSIGHDPLKPPG